MFSRSVPANKVTDWEIIEPEDRPNRFLPSVFAIILYTENGDLID